MDDKSLDMNEKIIRFFEGRPEVVAVYLFGSRARGQARDGSDLDLAILVHPHMQVDELELKRELMIDLSRVLREDLHLVILNRAGELLMAQVFKYGKVLYNPKPGVLSRFRAVQFSKIADFAYLRSMMQKGFTRKVMEAGY